MKTGTVQFFISLVIWPFSCPQNSTAQFVSFFLLVNYYCPLQTQGQILWKFTLKEEGNFVDTRPLQTSNSRLHALPGDPCLPRTIFCGAFWMQLQRRESPSPLVKSPSISKVLPLAKVLYLGVSSFLHTLIPS